MNIKYHYDKINKLKQRKKCLVKSVNKQIKSAKSRRTLAVYDNLYGKFSKEELFSLCLKAGIGEKYSIKISNILGV